MRNFPYDGPKLYAAEVRAARRYITVTDFVTAATEDDMLTQVDRIVALTPDDADLTIRYGTVSHPMQSVLDSPGCGGYDCGTCPDCDGC